LIWLIVDAIEDGCTDAEFRRLLAANDRKATVSRLLSQPIEDWGVLQANAKFCRWIGEAITRAVEAGYVRSRGRDRIRPGIAGQLRHMAAVAVLDGWSKRDFMRIVDFHLVERIVTVPGRFRDDL
jgi:hypothetical protein